MEIVMYTIYGRDVLGNISDVRVVSVEQGKILRRKALEKDKQCSVFNWYTPEVNPDSYSEEEKQFMQDDNKESLGLKYDQGKPLFSLLTRSLAVPLLRVAEVLTYGANKYKADSWQTIPNAKVRYEDALDRHLNAWKRGETHDPESGLHHLAHVATNALFLLWFYQGE